MPRRGGDPRSGARLDRGRPGNRLVRDPVTRDIHHVAGRFGRVHRDGWPIARALIEVAGVLPDFRAPDNLRFGMSPLYTSYQDVHTAVIRLKQVVESGLYEEFRHVTVTVT